MAIRNVIAIVILALLHQVCAAAEPYARTYVVSYRWEL
jgi:hypothetical protein